MLIEVNRVALVDEFPAFGLCSPAIPFRGFIGGLLKQIVGFGGGLAVEEVFIIIHRVVVFVGYTLLGVLLLLHAVAAVVFEGRSFELPDHIRAVFCDFEGRIVGFPVLSQRGQPGGFILRSSNEFRYPFFNEEVSDRLRRSIHAVGPFIEERWVTGYVFEAGVVGATSDFLRKIWDIVTRFVEFPDGVEYTVMIGVYVETRRVSGSIIKTSPKRDSIVVARRHNNTVSLGFEFGKNFFSKLRQVVNLIFLSPLAFGHSSTNGPCPFGFAFCWVGIVEERCNHKPIKLVAFDC